MKPSRFQRLRRIAKSDPVGLDRAVAAGLGEMRKLLEAREASYFKDCPRVPAGGEPHPGACAPSGEGGAARTDTPEFKRWFGDSKVVDKDGKPMVVYHGTAIFPGEVREEFDASELGKFTYEDRGAQGGFFFAHDYGDADMYAQRATARAGYDEEGSDAKPTIMPVFLSVKNPLIHDARNSAKIPRELLDDNAGLIAYAKRRGHDGVHIAAGDRANTPGTWIVFDPRQIKSVFNRGTWKPDSPKISESTHADAPKAEHSALAPGHHDLLEAQIPNTKAKLDQKKRPARQDLLDDIGGAYDELGFGDLEGDPNPLLAAQIDNRLGVGIWTGSTFEDRTTHAIDGFARNLVSDIETSLLAQESYGDFEARLFKKMGIADSKEPLGTLAQFDTLIRSEANLAWNEAMIAANADTDTALVWECQLKPTSTPGCIWRHGRTIDELQGETPLRHFGCGCFVTTIPDPDSQDPARAEAGRAMLAQMAAEREEAGGGDEFEESDAPPSRFHALRELARGNS